MGNEWKRGFASVAWRRFNPGGSPRPATKTHLREPHVPAVTLCGSAVPEASTEVGLGDVGEGVCVRCAVLAALRTDHAPAPRSHMTGGGWGANWGRVWRAGCGCGWDSSTNGSKREAETDHRDHVVGLVKAELGVK